MNPTPRYVVSLALFVILWFNTHVLGCDSRQSGSWESWLTWNMPDTEPEDRCVPGSDRDASITHFVTLNTHATARWTHIYPGGSLLLNGILDTRDLVRETGSSLAGSGTLNVHGWVSFMGGSPPSSLIVNADDIFLWGGAIVDDLTNLHFGSLNVFEASVIGDADTSSTFVFASSTGPPWAPGSSVDWQDGKLVGGGGVRNEAFFTVSRWAEGSLHISTELVNAGLIQLAPLFDGVITLGSSGAITNNTDGSLFLYGGQINGGPDSSGIHNKGSLSKKLSEYYVETVINVPLTNEGIVAVEEGTLKLGEGISYVQQPNGVTILGRHGTTPDNEPTIHISDGNEKMDIQADGVVRGTGLIKGKVHNAGTISPGFYDECEDHGVRAYYGEAPFGGSARFGKLKVEGDFTQTLEGTILIELGPDGADSLEVTGTATLGGNLIVRCFETRDGPTDYPRSIRIIQTSSKPGGAFDYVTPGYCVECDAQGVSLRKSNPTAFMPLVRLSQGRADWGHCPLGEARCGNEISASARIHEGWACDPPCECSRDPVCGVVPMNQATIGEAGCVLTSAAMIENALYPGMSEESTPLLLNEETDVFSNDHVPNGMTNDMSWCRFVRYLNRVHYPALYHKRINAPLPLHGCGDQQPSERALWQETVANYIRGLGVPVAVRLARGHTVVAYRVTVEDGHRRILIHDPGYARTYLDEYSDVQRIDVITPNSSCNCGPQLSLHGCVEITANCPVEMILTDAGGARVGKDPRTGAEFSEIAGATYEAVAPNDIEAAEYGTQHDRDTLRKIAHLQIAPATPLTVEVVGTGEGQATLTFERAGRSQEVGFSEPVVLDVAGGSLDLLEASIPASGDVDADGDVDVTDFGPFVSCMWGPSGEPGGMDCGVFDFTPVGHVDLSDYAVMQRIFSGCLARCDGALCGNGVVNVAEGEYCDPPDDAWCDASCLIVPGCGNRVVEEGETCDPPDGLWCDDSCLLIPGCGNGHVEGSEECDPPDGIACNDGCERIVCGDGVIEGEEECDPPEYGLCNQECRLIICGDGIVDEPEECDPPDEAWCDTACQIIPGCGNGIIDEGEQCDPPDGETCGAECEWLVCGEGNGDCHSMHSGPGCDDAACCQAVCAQDSYCCEWSWYDWCVELAAECP